jgi:hypothetical protein
MGFNQRVKMVPGAWVEEQKRGKKERVVLAKKAE